jgi:hypothetical protein
MKRIADKLFLAGGAGTLITVVSLIGGVGYSMISGEAVVGGWLFQYFGAVLILVAVSIALILASLLIEQSLNRSGP